MSIRQKAGKDNVIMPVMDLDAAQGDSKKIDASN